MEIVEIKRSVHDYYRSMVKGNSLNNIELSRRKLTRNIILGKNIGISPYGHKIIKYGQLYIYFNKEKNRVVRLENIKGDNVIDMKDNNEFKEKYDKLNEDLGINKLQEQLFKEHIEKKKYVSGLMVDEMVVDHWNKIMNTNDNSGIVERKIKNRILWGEELTPFIDQLNNGRQFYKNGNMLICVVEDREITYIRWIDEKKFEKVS